MAFIPDVAKVHLGKMTDYEIKTLKDTGAIDTFKKQRTTLLYVPEPLDSVITGNEATTSKITINGIDILDIDRGMMDTRLSIQADNEMIDDMSTYTMTFDGKHIGTMLVWNNESIAGESANIELLDPVTYGKTSAFSQ